MNKQQWQKQPGKRSEHCKHSAVAQHSSASKFTESWAEPIHVMLKRLKLKHDLSWLCIQMPHSRFQNLGELLQGDPAKKLREGVQSKDFMDRVCSCNTASEQQGNTCHCQGNCRKSIIVHKVTCKADAAWSTLETVNNAASKG